MILEFQLNELITVPYAQYGLNERQIINVIPLPSEIAALIEVEGFETWHWGKLSELNFIMECQTRNSLIMDNWNFELYPNPEIVILNKLTH